MAQRGGNAKSDGTSRNRTWLVRPTDSYGAVLLLTLLDYVAISTIFTNLWGRAVVNALLGLTLVFTLRTSRSRRIWQTLAVLYLVVSVVSGIVSALGPQTIPVGELTTFIGWLLLIVTPVVIMRRISTHTVVTTETVLGAVCVYLLIGFSFAAIYAANGYIGATSFFGPSVPNPTINEYLFFSYTTLTTVGYGNLVPATSTGQTLAMLEALSGQIYLVIIVARLVSLWGQAATRVPPGKRAALDADGAPTADDIHLPERLPSRRDDCSRNAQDDTANDG